MPPTSSPSSSKDHWSGSIKIVTFILVLWFVVSLGCGVLFREALDNNLPNIGGAPFGFWMAQQGAIIGFLVLLVVYMVLMNRLDAKHGYNDRGDV